MGLTPKMAAAPQTGRRAGESNLVTYGLSRRDACQCARRIAVWQTCERSRPGREVCRRQMVESQVLKCWAPNKLCALVPFFGFLKNQGKAPKRVPWEPMGRPPPKPLEAPGCLTLCLRGGRTQAEPPPSHVAPNAPTSPKSNPYWPIQQEVLLPV